MDCGVKMKKEGSRAYQELFVVEFPCGLPMCMELASNFSKIGPQMTEKEKEERPKAEEEKGSGKEILPPSLLSLVHPGIEGVGETAVTRRKRDHLRWARISAPFIYSRIPMSIGKRGGNSRNGASCHRRSPRCSALQSNIGGSWLRRPANAAKARRSIRSSRLGGIAACDGRCGAGDGQRMVRRLSRSPMEPPDSGHCVGPLPTPLVRKHSHAYLPPLPFRFALRRS